MLAPARQSEPKPAAPPRQLSGALPVWLLLALATASAVLGALLANSLIGLQPVRAADVAFRLAALAALALPALQLQMLTTPKHGPTRRWLGEASSQQVRSALADSAKILLATLAGPLGLALALAQGGESPHLALLVASGQVGAWAGSAAALLVALGMVGGERRQAFELLSGGGVFGPAEAAPLLYAPALGLLLGLVPAALLSAWLGARPSQGPWPVSAAILAATAVLGAVLVRRAWAATVAGMHAGLRAVELAHATPFAQGQLLPELPPWLDWPPVRDALERWYLLGWSRQHPASHIAVALLVGLAAVAARDDLTALNWLGVGLGIGWYAAARTGELADSEVATVADWLGEGRHGARPAARRLALQLGGQALLTFGLASVATPFWAPLAGSLSGIALGWVLAGRWRGAAARWWPRLGPALAVLSLAATRNLGAS